MEKINEAIALYDVGKKIEAKEVFLKLFEENHDVEIARHIAKLYKSVNEPLDAIFFYEKSLEIEPSDWVGLNNLGLLWEGLGYDEKAKDFYIRSLKVKENYEANYNLGVVLRKLGNFSNSVKYLRRAYVLKPENYNANYSLAMSYLIQKDFKNGYPYFLKREKNHPKLFREWKGEKCGENKSISVYSDGGFGDIIMFARYIPLLREYFEKIYFICPLILQNVFGIEGVEYAKGGEKPDYTISLLDLPYYLKCDFNHIPPYNNIVKIKKGNNKHEKPHIGLCWRGNTAITRVLKNRSIKLKSLEKLLNNDDFEFFAFQKDVEFAEISEFPKIKNLGIDFNTFEDTANALKDIDVLITVDTAILHLAGTMGIKTYLILPESSEWRWFEDTDKTRWYESVKIFKQSKTHDINQIAEDIIKTLAI